MRGDQLIECDEDLSEIEHYFVNPLESEEEESEEEPEEEGFEFEVQEMRTFSVDIKFTPPAEEAEGE